jgi:hypothetical protein
MDQFFPENYRKELEQSFIDSENKRIQEHRKNNPVDKTTDEYYENLLTDISETYKEVYGIRPRGFIHEMTLKELEEISDKLDKTYLQEMAEDKAEKQMYNELLERSKTDDNIQVFDNPEYEKYPHEYPGHYPKVFTKSETTSNNLESAFLNAKKLKTKKKSPKI